MCAQETIHESSRWVPPQAHVVKKVTLFRRALEAAGLMSKRMFKLGIDRRRPSHHGFWSPDFRPLPRSRENAWSTDVSDSGS